MMAASTRLSASSATTDDQRGSTGIPDRFVEGYYRFKASAAPSRILFYHHARAGASWVDFPGTVFDELLVAFVAGKAVFELPVDGANYLFDFVRSVRINLSTKAVNPIAWVDADGRSFFPRGFSGADCKAMISVAAELSDEETGPRFPGTETLREGEGLYRDVEKLFINGMRGFAPNARVTAVRRCAFVGQEGASRKRAFLMKAAAAKAERGDASVGVGWFGASPDVIARVVKDGFGTSEGRVLNLSQHRFPFGSYVSAEADGAGEKHLLLCRVIIGAVPVRHQDSGNVFDEQLANRYVVQGEHADAHILPQYIVSFNASSPSHRQPSANSWRTSGMCFEKLLAEMGRSLPSPTMHALKILYSKYKLGKMSKDALIRYLRSVAGDKLLASSIRRIRGY